MLPIQGAWVWFLVRELDPICCNQDLVQLNIFFKKKPVGPTLLVLTVAYEILPHLVPITSLTSPTLPSLFLTLFNHTGLHSVCLQCTKHAPTLGPLHLLFSPSERQVCLHLHRSGSSWTQVSAQGLLPREGLLWPLLYPNTHSHCPRTSFTSSTAFSTCEMCSGGPGLVTSPGLSTGLGGCTCSTLVLNNYSSQAPCLPSIMCLWIRRHRMRAPTQTPILSRTLGEWQGLSEARMEGMGWASRASSQLRESPGWEEGPGRFMEHGSSWRYGWRNGSPDRQNSVVPSYGEDPSGAGAQTLVYVVPEPTALLPSSSHTTRPDPNRWSQ